MIHIYNVGHRVVVVYPGQCYDTYATLASKLKLTNWTSYYLPKPGTAGTITAFGSHEDSGELIYGIRLDNGHDILIDISGVRAAGDKMKKQSQNRYNDKRRSNYQHNKRLLAGLNRIWPERGIVMTDERGGVFTIISQGFFGASQRRGVKFRQHGYDIDIETDMSLFLHNKRFVLIRRVE